MSRIFLRSRIHWADIGQHHILHAELRVCVQGSIMRTHLRSTMICKQANVWADQRGSGVWSQRFDEASGVYPYSNVKCG
jgi:hypothetical protein